MLRRARCCSVRYDVLLLLLMLLMLLVLLLLMLLVLLLLLLLLFVFAFFCLRGLCICLELFSGVSCCCYVSVSFQVHALLAVAALAGVCCCCSQQIC